MLGLALILCFASWLTVHLAITAELQIKGYESDHNQKS